MVQSFASRTMTAAKQHTLDATIQRSLMWCVYLPRRKSKVQPTDVEKINSSIDYVSTDVSVFEIARQRPSLDRTWRLRHNQSVQKEDD
jgi:hypothetical protein